MKAHFIIYVDDQAIATNFYSLVLNQAPRLNVPGMTEFEIVGNTVIGLMPLASASNLLGVDLVSAKRPFGCAEIYLIVDDPKPYHARAIENGAIEISPLQPRTWGHSAAYSIDPFSTILAFASDNTLEATSDKQ
jgi:uncharacterized glyoxalase superfamily protein PhnB